MTNTLYRSNLVFESRLEADVVAKAVAHAGNFLPGDFRVCAVDEGHHLAFYSEDRQFCEKINERIANNLASSIDEILQSPTFENDRRSKAERRAECEREGWGFRGYTISLTPQHPLTFTGWHEVNA